MAIQYAAFALGISAMMTQIALMRELLSLVNGNEIGLGFLLGNWLLITGLGVWLGQRPVQSYSVAFLGYALAILAFLPWILIVLVRLWHTWFFIRGAELDIGMTFLTSLLLVSPYCLGSGFLFGLTTVLFARINPLSLLSRLYTFDCLGSIVGGVLFTMLALFSIDHFSILLWPAGFLYLASFLCGIESHRKSLTNLSLLLMVFLPGGFLISNSIDRLTLALQYPEQEIQYHKISPNGQIVATRTSGQLNFYANGELIFSTQNTQQLEESVHYGMSQRPHAKDVLLISGGISGVAKELCKYPLHNLEYIELDRSLLDAGRFLVASNLVDDRITVQIADGRVFIEKTRKKYDVVIVNVSSPNTLLMNRFFTVEFFQAIKKCIGSEGVVTITLNPYANAMSSELSNTYATMAKTIQAVFKNMLVVPGGRTYFIASESALYPDISERLSQAKIDRICVTSNYIADIMRPDRLSIVQSAVSSPSSLNRDLNPTLYWRQNIYWLSQFHQISWWILIIVGGFLFLFAFRQNSASFSLFTAGFCGSTMQLVLLWAFQICCGSLFLQLGFLSAVFMGGLALGSWILNRRFGTIKSIHLIGLNGFMMVFAGGLLLLLPVVFQFNSRQIPMGAIHLFFIFMTGLLSFGVGAQFPVACKWSSSFSNASLAKFYASDLLGACLGAFATSTLLMPLLGIRGCCYLCGLANFLVALRLFRQQLKGQHET